MAEKQIGITIKKEDEFSEWFQQIILKADLADYTAVSGCIVFKPASYAIWEKLVSVIDKEYKKTGVKNAYFPLFIPESILMKEAEHFAGFTPEVAWVTHSGNTKLNERLAIRPTSETIMYDSYSKWIRSHRDLPLKINQWNNVIRWEFKHPVPFFRTREFLWNEGHTVFATQAEAVAERDVILSIYENFLKDYMALPYIIGQKSDKEKFAGALFTCSLEMYMPNGKAIQGPDFHHDGQNFAKAYDIKFKDTEGNSQYAWQNTWAITTRMLGVMFAIHSDNKGLVLPPKLAPTQIIIVPIFKDDKIRKQILLKADAIKKQLSKHTIEIDDREEYTPGWKFNEWEMKGIPIRLEIGPKDLAANQVVLVRRDTGTKEMIKIPDLKEVVAQQLDDMHDNLYKVADKLLKDHVIKADTWDEFVKGIKDKKIVLIPHCGESECEDWVKEKSGGAKSLNRPYDENQPKTINKKQCIHCKKPAKYLMHFGKSY
ncbi:proline--tRNA ligase [Nanoarchaeota archaeon]